MASLYRINYAQVSIPWVCKGMKNAYSFPTSSFINKFVLCFSISIAIYISLRLIVNFKSISTCHGGNSADAEAVVNPPVIHLACHMAVAVMELRASCFGSSFLKSVLQVESALSQFESGTSCRKCRHLRELQFSWPTKNKANKQNSDTQQLPLAMQLRQAKTNAKICEFCGKVNFPLFLVLC